MRVLLPSPVLLVVFASLLTPQPGRAQEGEGHQVQLLARNAAWTMTGITVAANDLVVIFATGSIMVGGMRGMSGQIDPDGRTTFPSGRPTGAEGLGSIEAMIGDESTFRVGSRYAFIANRIGALKLRVFDTNYAENSGWFTVTIIRIPANAVPPVLPYSP
jgi:hypothetical protein